MTFSPFGLLVCLFLFSYFIQNCVKTCMFERILPLSCSKQHLDTWQTDVNQRELTTTETSEGKFF